MEKLIEGQKLIRKSDKKIFTFDRNCEIGFGNIYVKELQEYVYRCDFEVMEAKIVKKLYIVMIYNEPTKRWEMTTGFYYRVEDAEAVLKSMFYNIAIAAIANKPTLQIFYTLDIYSNKVKLISVDDKDEIIIEGGLFEHE